MDELHLVFYNQFLFLSIGPGAVGQLVLLKFCWVENFIEYNGK